MQLITVGDYLLARLEELGIKDIIGVPGDFNLDLVDQIESDNRFKWIGECNELNASYAADGYARIHGISALITTYGPGELSAVNGIAGAYAEHVPVIKITGAPALAKQARRLAVHHTLLNGEYNQSHLIYQHLTCANAVLDFGNPGEQIDSLIEQCFRHKLPVYLQIPQDVLSLKIPAPQNTLNLAYAAIHESHLAQVLQAIQQKLAVAVQPVFLIGELVARYQLQGQIEKFLQTSGYPYVVSWGAKGVVSEHLPNFKGMYAGSFSLDEVKNYVENSDCVISLGWINCEVNSGTFTCKLDKEQLVEVLADEVILDGIPLVSLNLARVVDGVIAGGYKYNYSLPKFNPHYEINETKLAKDIIEHDNLILRLSQFLQPHDTLVLETGTISFTSGYYKLPPQVQIISSVNWMSIGYALGATTGIALAKHDNGRTILVVGDGSLQMTAQAISTMLRQHLNPIILVLNNSGYTVERIFLGENAEYNDIQPWSYQLLAQVFGGKALTERVITDAELITSLVAARKQTEQMCIIEVMMDKYKQPLALQKLAAIAAKIN